MTLNYDQVPDCPQKSLLMQVADRVCASDDVVAIWVAGSIAQGASDEFSDVDLWVAVQGENVDAWRESDLAPLFGDTKIVGRSTFPIGPEGYLHALLLSNGMSFDLAFQTLKRELDQEPRLLLGCRDDVFGKKLVDRTGPKEFEAEEEVAAKVEDMVNIIWIHSNKHRKVLHRNLPLVSVFINRLERQMLLRMWYLLHAIGKIPANPIGAITIHGMTRFERVVQEYVPEEAKAIYVGPEIADRKALCDLIEATRDEVSKVGRALAKKYAFDYPLELEETVRNSWQVFRKQLEKSG